jgi:D-alanyl-D-alanine carboxypeptidase/D-alanyl-D-alanine-endopeptidase (penicillin-binding protein 4)
VSKTGPRLIAGLIGLVCLCGGSLAPALAKEPSPRALRKGIERIVGRPGFAPAFWGVEVRSLKTGKILYQRNAGKNLEPASTLKLVTTAAVLDAYGSESRLQTTLETAGRLDGLGRVLGDVYLVGRGDPNLSGRFFDDRITTPFERLAESLLAGGVRRVEGRLVGHEGLFVGDRRGDDWAWDDLVWWYGAEVSALSFNDNCADLVVRPGELPGDPVVVERNPVSSYYTVVSTATTSVAGSENELTLTPDLGSNTIRLSGTFPRGDRPRELFVAMKDPARYAATVLMEVLESRGILVTGGVATSSAPLPDQTRVLAAHASPPMSEAVREVNKNSQNLHAEMLLRLLGQRVKGEGSVEAAQEALEEFLDRLQVPRESWALQDGSGLSRSNLLSAHGLVALLVAMDRHPQAGAFRDSLAVAGIDGTLEKRMTRSPARGRILAKTGTLRHANALAGYATTRTGSRLAFAILVNHHTVPGGRALAAIDAICALLVR